MNLTYTIGSTIVYTTFTGEHRTVEVECRDENVKDGRPGFDGTDVDSGEAVWGYDSQVVRVVRI